MRIATWNVNSVRARLPNVMDWLGKVRPDILLLQEIKCETDAFPEMDFTMAGYNLHVLGQKTYNGVALASLHKIDVVREGLPGFEGDDQARYLEATIEGIRVASIYAPNGNPLGSDKFEYKLKWMRHFKRHARNLLRDEKPVVLGGDFNVLQTERDVYDPKGWEQDALYAPEVRAEFREILNLGLTEAYRALHPDEQAYSFWDYQGGAWQQDKGLRLDLFLVSPEAADRTNGCLIAREERGKDKASDHVPVILDLQSN